MQKLQLGAHTESPWKHPLSHPLPWGFSIQAFQWRWGKNNNMAKMHIRVRAHTHPYPRANPGRRGSLAYTFLLLEWILRLVPPLIWLRGEEFAACMHTR